MATNKQRRQRENEFLKMDAFKENWYALAACMCSSKVKSRSQAFSLMGIKIAKEPGIVVSKKLEFEKSKVESLYKELGSVRQVALALGCNQSTLSKFFKRENIKTYDVRPKKADKYDKEAIRELRTKGKNIKEVAIILGYDYAVLYKFIRATMAH